MSIKSYRSKCKKEYVLEGLTKLICKDKIDYLVGKIIEMDHVMCLVLGAKFGEKGLHLFSIPLSLWRNYNNSSRQYSFGLKINESLNRWNNLRMKSRSHFSTFIPFGKSNAYIAMDKDTNISQLDEKYDIASMYEYTSNKSNPKLCIKYDNYILASEGEDNIEESSIIIFSKKTDNRTISNHI